MEGDHSKKQTLRLPLEGHWSFKRSLDARIQRTEKPTLLNLDQAIRWIKKEKPIIWLGSIFSTPKPSAFPSGWALTESLLEIALNGIPETIRYKLIKKLSANWPLEALLDEFDFIGYDLSESLLGSFEWKNRSASPSVLHHAVTQYYNKGFARRPLCITSNWDTLQEKDFRNEGYKVTILSPGQRLSQGFRLPTKRAKTIFIYHPHGSFETHDVICSLAQEQTRLPVMPMDVELMLHPTLFLGYSGYEPSLYETLESGTTSQLWCIRDESDFEIPAKRRLLSRPNTFVYKGDIQELLRGLGVLENDVEFTNVHVARENPDIPPLAIELVQSTLIASLDVEVCISLLSGTLISSFDEPEATIRYTSLMKVLVNHIRNRVIHPGILPTLLASARFRDSEQLWITILAYLLRNHINLDSKTIDKLIKYSDEAHHNSKESVSPNDDLVYTRFGRIRSDVYKHLVGHKSEFDDDESKFYREMTFQVIPISAGDLAMNGEFMEIFAFLCLREGNQDLAQNCFDSAATSYYLCGLWNAGQINEWAANNIGRLVDISKGNTLVIPIEQQVESTSAG